MRCGGQPPETHGLSEIDLLPRVGFPTFSSYVIQIGMVPIVATVRDAACRPGKTVVAFGHHRAFLTQQAETIDILVFFLASLPHGCGRTDRLRR